MDSSRTPFIGNKTNLKRYYHNTPFFNHLFSPKKTPYQSTYHRNALLPIESVLSQSIHHRSAFNLKTKRHQAIWLLLDGCLAILLILNKSKKVKRLLIGWLLLGWLLLRWLFLGWLLLGWLLLRWLLLTFNLCKTPLGETGCLSNFLGYLFTSPAFHPGFSDL